MPLAAPKSSTAAVTAASTAWPEEGLESVKACPACGNSARELLHGGLRDRVFFCAPGEWNLYRCAKCGTGYLDPRPDAATIALAYSKYYTHNSAGDVGGPPRNWWRRRRVAQRNAYLNGRYNYQLSPADKRSPSWLSAERRHRFDRFVCFLRYPGNGARVLDIGCGNGRVMMQLRSVGWEVSGVEPDPKSAAQARAAGLDVRAGSTNIFCGPCSRSLRASAVGKNANMHTPETVQRFIERRAQGWTYTRLMTELNVTKPTLIAWSRKHQFEIQNLRAIELEALREKWLASTSERVNSLGEQLQRVETELARRDLAALTTPQLMSAARNLRHQIDQATGPMQFTIPLNEIPSEELHEQVQDWKA
jgi:hypothetical protein